MKKVLFILAVGLAIVSTACGASIRDAERNVRGADGVASILRYPSGQSVDNDDYFVVCNHNGNVGIATLTVYGTGLVADAEVNWIEDGTACGPKLDNLTEAQNRLDWLKRKVAEGASLEELRETVRTIEWREEEARR